MNDCKKIHRSSPSLDLISMAIDVVNDDDERSTKMELSQKRISTNYGWDHYGSCNNKKYRKNKYQHWREGKKIRRSTIGTIDLRQLSKLSLHTTFSSITEHSNESTSASSSCSSNDSSSSSFETEDQNYHHTQRISKVIPHSESALTTTDSYEQRDRHSVRNVRIPHRLSTM